MKGVSSTMALDLYRALWTSCDELRGGMCASQYKDYVLTLLFVKYVTDKAKSALNSLTNVPEGGSFDDILALRGAPEIGRMINTVIGRLAEANGLQKVIDMADFNDQEKLGNGKEMQDRLTRLVTILSDLDFRDSRADGDDLLGDAYEYLMRHFATDAGKSKGQFYTPAEVSRVLAKVVGIGPGTRQDQTVIDPACGSGSLLLKVAAEAPSGVAIYGQEKDNATWALAKMNMILHGHKDADIQKGDTLTNPQFTHGGRLRTFDFAVMNPPFSTKSWSNGLEHEYGRFEFGRPPEKNGDYAFLLHVLSSLKSTGRAAVILPHGVLFRGNAEAGIRRQLLQRGYIKGVIGLPANLFYGTGIAACIVVLDKENTAGRTGVFVIDASKGFMKDGPKNRLRSQDVHKIVDVFTRQAEISGYSRMVPLAEIAGDAHGCNLSIRRYIDSSQAEDIQDLHAHLHGGIPDRDIEALQAYWDAFPQLRSALFTANRPGYSDLAIDLGQVRQAILDAPEFQEFSATLRDRIAQWFAPYRPALAAITADTRPDDLITALGDDLLARFRPTPLLDEYDVYEQLMTYWHTTMHDDVVLIMTKGWAGAARPREIVEDKNRQLSDTPDLVIGSGRAAVKYKTGLIPPSLIVACCFADECGRADDLDAQAKEAVQAVVEYAERQAAEDGPLAEVMDNDKMSRTLAATRLREARRAGAGTDPEEIAALQHLIGLCNDETAAKKNAKDARSALDLTALDKYGDLSEAEIKSIVIDSKWLAAVTSRVEGELNSLVFALVSRIRQLGERYGETVGQLKNAVSDMDSRIAAHLADMGCDNDAS